MFGEFRIFISEFVECCFYGGWCDGIYLDIELVLFGSCVVGQVDDVGFGCVVVVVQLGVYFGID